MRKIISIVALAAGLGLGLGACSSGGDVSTAPATHAPTGPSQAALAEWNATANIPNASLGTTLISIANDLPASDAKQIAELNQLASIPNTNATPTQQAEAQNDVTALDAMPLSLSVDQGADLHVCA